MGEYIDPFDADHDPSEVAAAVPDAWHESFKLASPVHIDSTKTEHGLRALEEVIGYLRKYSNKQVRKGDVAERLNLSAITCWHDTPELYRRMVAYAAGVDKSVIDKADRDLTEKEKELIRSAVRDMRGYFDSLVRL